MTGSPVIIMLWLSQFHLKSSSHILKYCGSIWKYIEMVSGVRCRRSRFLRKWKGDNTRVKMYMYMKYAGRALLPWLSIEVSALISKVRRGKLYLKSANKRGFFSSTLRYYCCPHTTTHCCQSSWHWCHHSRTEIQFPLWSGHFCTEPLFGAPANSECFQYCRAACGASRVKSD